MGVRAQSMIKRSQMGSVGQDRVIFLLRVRTPGWVHGETCPFTIFISPVSCPAPLFPPPRSAVKLTKKRALSISPLSDASLDLQTVIRTSPSSLVAFINSRCASPGGSYGHLSISTVRCKQPQAKRAPKLLPNPIKSLKPSRTSHPT